MEIHWVFVVVVLSVLHIFDKFSKLINYPLKLFIPFTRYFFYSVKQHALLSITEHLFDYFFCILVVIPVDENIGDGYVVILTLISYNSDQVIFHLRGLLSVATLLIISIT